jgi:hypothetical protein
MARYAMVQDSSGVVVNVIEWDGNTATWAPPAGYTMVEDTNNEIGVGGTYEDGTYTPPPSGQPGAAA